MSRLNRADADENERLLWVQLDDLRRQLETTMHPEARKKLREKIGEKSGEIWRYRRNGGTHE